MTNTLAVLIIGALLALLLAGGVRIAHSHVVDHLADHGAVGLDEVCACRAWRQFGDRRWRRWTQPATTHPSGSWKKGTPS